MPESHTFSDGTTVTCQNGNIDIIKGEWSPVGNDYYCIASFGDVERWQWNNHPVDRERYELGNCYQTKELAEKEVHRRKEEVRLRRKLAEMNKGVEREELGYYFSLDNIDKSIEFNYQSDFPNQSTIGYAHTEEIAQQLLDEEEEALKLVLFPDF